MRKFGAEYNEWCKTKHFCKCGCGTEITLTYRSFVYHMEKNGKPPEYSSIHKKYAKEYKEWLASKPVCQCGCGQPMISNYMSFADAMYRTGKPPKFRAHHGHRKRGQLNPKVVSKQPAVMNYIYFNGCKIIPTRKEQRCDAFKNCAHYLDCLEYIIVEKKHLGWIRET